MSDTESTTDDSIDVDDPPRNRGAIAGPDADEYDPLELYDLQRHRNGDETAVLVCAFGGGYQALALDVDAGGQLLELEVIGDAPEREKAVGMCEYWLDQNPDGVLGGAAEGGGGVLSRLFGGGGA